MPRLGSPPATTVEQLGLVQSLPCKTHLLGKGSSYQVLPRHLERNGGSHLLLVSWGLHKLWVLLPQFPSCSTRSLSCGLGPWLLGFGSYLGWRGCACQAWVREQKSRILHAAKWPAD